LNNKYTLDCGRIGRSRVGLVPSKFVTEFACGDLVVADFDYDEFVCAEMTTSIFVVPEMSPLLQFNVIGGFGVAEVRRCRRSMSLLVLQS
jgi:hypothetical protein